MQLPRGDLSDQLTDAAATTVHDGMGGRHDVTALSFAATLVVSALLWRAVPLLRDHEVLLPDIVLWSLCVVALAWAGWRFARAAVPPRPVYLVLVVAGVLAHAIAATVVAILGAMGALRLPPLLLALAAVLLGAAVAPARGEESAGEPARDVTRMPAQLFAALVGLLAWGIQLLNTLRYFEIHSDAMWYRWPMVAEWTRTGSIRPIETILELARAYPGFREAVQTFLTLPVGNEHLALLPWEPILWAGVVYGACRAIGATQAVSAAAAVYALSVPQAHPGPDLLLAVLFVLALLFLLRFMDRGAQRDALVAGLALGALAATKYSGVVYAGILLFAAAVQLVVVKHPILREPRRFAGAGALIIAGMLLVAGVWYARNVYYYGNPLYPAELSIAGRIVLEGPFTLEERDARTLGWNIRPLIASAHHFVQAFGLLMPILALTGAGIAASVLVWRRSVRGHLMLLLLPPLCFIAFLHQPYNRPSFSYEYNMRYLLPWFAASLITGVLTATAARSMWIHRAVVVVFLLASIHAISRWTGAWWLIVVIATVAVPILTPVLARLVDRPRRLLRVPGLVIAAGAVAIATALALPLARVRAALQYHPDYGYSDAPDRPGWGSVASYVHRHVRGQRIAVVGDIRFFPLYGDDFSNVVMWLGFDMTREDALPEAKRRQADLLVCFHPVRERASLEGFVFDRTFCRDVAGDGAAPHIRFESGGAFVLDLQGMSSDD